MSSAGFFSAFPPYIQKRVWSYLRPSSTTAAMFRPSPLSLPALQASTHAWFLSLRTILLERSLYIASHSGRFDTPSLACASSPVSSKT